MIYQVYIFCSQICKQILAFLVQSCFPLVSPNAFLKYTYIWRKDVYKQCSPVVTSVDKCCRFLFQTQRNVIVDTDISLYLASASKMKYCSFLSISIVFNIVYLLLILNKICFDESKLSYFIRLVVSYMSDCACFYQTNV